MLVSNVVFGRAELGGAHLQSMHGWPRQKGHELKVHSSHIEALFQKTNKFLVDMEESNQEVLKFSFGV